MRSTSACRARRSSLAARLSLCVSAGLVACGGSPASPDAASTEPGDLGARSDLAGGSDLASATDGAAPLRVDQVAIACADEKSDVYVTPPNLAPMTPADRGAIVRCAHDPADDLTVAKAGAAIAGKGLATKATSGAHIYYVAFRTTRGDGSDGLSSARLYLPDTPRSLPLPVITIGHPTTGLAASCAPSKDATSNEDLALPFAALGYAAIVSDYAGLGTDGTQGYLDNHDQAHSVLDAARALRNLLPAGALSDDVLAVGYSQGGGAVLSAQALEKDYGAGGHLIGVVAFAPEWPTRDDSFGYVSELANPTELTIATGISEDVVTVMREYAFFANHVGLSHAGDAFPAASRQGIESAVATLCQTPLGGYLQGTALHVGDLFDPTFRTSLAACIGSRGMGCDPAVAPFYAFLEANLVTSDPTGAPVLYIQGLLDPIMPPASEAACNIEKMKADGVTPQVCTDALAVHTNVVGRNMDFALAWIEALLAGTPLPACSASGMPGCTP